MANLIEITAEKFYATLNKDARDIMPRIVGKDATGEYIQEWRANNMRGDLFGKSVGKRYWTIQQGEAV